MKKFKCFVVFLVFFGLTFAVFGAGNGKNKSTLISNSANETVVTFNLDSYDFERVMTPQGVELAPKAPHAGRILKQGAPDLVKFSTAVIIPDQGKMGIEVIDARYTETDKVMIAPSKGNLLRDQDPSHVPYVYGKEYKKDAFFPGKLAELNDPYIARDFRGQAAILYPFQYNPVTGILRVYTTLTVKVYKKGNAGENEFNRNKPLRLDEIVHEFKNVYSRHFINFDAMTQAETGISSLQYTPLQDPMGRMLIVCYSSFMSNMSSFVSYKQSIGYTVDLVDYSTIGSAAALKTYVANYYNTNGLSYLLLVGDNAQVPVSSTTAGDSDNDYGFIVGGDHYLDIFVGRFSAETTAHVDTQVNRTIWYERDLASSSSWFRHTTGMGTSEGPGHNSEYDYQHADNFLTDLSGYGYTTHTNHQSGGSTANLSGLINGGQGTIWYCGHGNIDGWYCGWTFLNANVTALTNTGMLPAVFSVACQVGNFKTNTCFCEYWQRSTSGGNAIGSVAHCGSTINQSWIPPMDAQDEMVDLLVSASGPKRTFGGVFVNGMFKMNDLNGTGGYDMTDTWVCFGDSSVQLRTPGTPNGPGGGGPTPPTANFSGSPTTVTVGGTVNFTDTSTGSPTSWSWTFSGGTPGTSTAQNPTVTYNTIGTYNVSLTATNAQGSDVETKVGYITVSEPSYCASQGSNYSYEWIARVQVGSLDNSSGAAGYTDFTGINVNLTGGNNASVTLTPGFASSTYTEYWKIWIDYNGDHDFADTGEEEFSGSGTSAVSGSFTVNTGVNITTRMRVSMKYNAAPTSCETFSYGEVEDYTVTVSTGTTQPPVAAFTASATTVTVGGSVTFTDQSTNSPTSWSWSFPGGTPSTSTAQNPTITYNTVGAYNVSLTASNAAGSDDEVKTNYITVTSAPTDDIAEGVDYTATFTKSGNANWTKVTDVYYYGGDSAKSGAITHSQSTTIQTSITAASTQAVKFYWKVSSESGYDYLRFYIDGVQKNQISGTVDWTQVSNNITSGTHTLTWTYSKDSSVSSGSDCGWVDKLEVTTPSADPIAEAVDYTGLTFTLTGNANWYSQTTTTYYGGDAAQSGLISHSQSSSMETTISGKTSVKFYWRVSSEANYDYLRFYIDGALQTSISGSPSWAQKTYTVTSGTHTLKWTYVKDGSVSSGSDCGWVDKLELN